MTLYHNGNIVTMDEALPAGNYMVIDNGRILEIGRGEAPGLYGGAERIDLKGRTVVPGFWESHLHIVDGMRSLAELNLRGLDGLGQLKTRLEAYVGRLGDGDWVIGHGWDERSLFGGKFPDRQLLDSLCTDRPMALMRMDGHSMCLNTCAITALELERRAGSPEVPLGPDGIPAGMFFENAAFEIDGRIRKSLAESYFERLVLEAQELFLKNGICSVNDICTQDPGILALYRRLDGEGKLALRITAAPNGLDADSVRCFEEGRPFESGKLRIGFPKYFMDGSFGSKTALLTEDYSDDPGNRGLKLISDDELDGIIKENHSAGRAVAIHAIGDKAVSDILDRLEHAARQGGHVARDRIEHIQIVKDEDIGRFRPLGTTASFQPVFLYEGEMTRSRLGEKRLGRTYRFKSFIKSGANVIFNSDWPYGGGAFPVKPDGTRYIGFEPLLGMDAAAARHTNPEERVSALEALKCYTVNAAYANYCENRLGMLKKGYWADFVVLSDDITRLEPGALKDVAVLATVVGGKMAYSNM